MIPADYDPIAELRFVTDVAAALLDLPEALCYFNPNGEVLLDRAAFRAALHHAAAASLLPLVVWGNVRLFNIDKTWRLMDIVGNGQVDRSDLEACFTTRYDLNEVGNFLRNATGYLITNGEVIRDGDTMDGPGGVRWQARASKTALVNPDRRVLSWRPMDGTRMPDLPGRRGG